MKLKDLFKRRKKYASPYYGGKGPLVNAPTFPQEREETKPALDISHVRTLCPRPNDVDWEQRRFELMKILIAQDRRSVVLGKLKATDKEIAAKSRALADAAIKELQTHPYKRHEEAVKGRRADAE